MTKKKKTKTTCTVEFFSVSNLQRYFSSSGTGNYALVLSLTRTALIGLVVLPTISTSMSIRPVRMAEKYQTWATIQSRDQTPSKHHFTVTLFVSLSRQNKSLNVTLFFICFC